MVSNILWGVALGDAVGNPLEFDTPTREGFLKSVNAPVLRVTDDTQMTLFLAQSLSLGRSPVNGYLDWYRTQKSDRVGFHGLLKFQSMFNVEAPGKTCLNSCRALIAGTEVVNTSKGNGTVMRCAPVAIHAYLNSLSHDQARSLAKTDALITHKHPYAWMSSVTAVTIYLNLLSGLSLWNALNASREVLRGIVATPVLDMVYGSLDFGTYKYQVKTLEGWVAEEALALAVGAVAHSTSYMGVIEKATVFPGDSDTVAAIAGGLAAACGMDPPRSLCDKLNAKDAIDYVLTLYN